MSVYYSSPKQRVTPVVPLSKREVEEFLAGFEMSDDSPRSHSPAQLESAFRHLTGETQRLLVQSRESGLTSEQFILFRLDEYCFTLFREWDESGEYESFDEATAIADSRLFSSLLVLECLGDSLRPLGHPDSIVYLLTAAALNEFVTVAYGEHQNCAAYRLDTYESVSAVAGVVTYAAVDSYLSEAEVALKGRDDRDPLFFMAPDVYPRSALGEGFHCDSLGVFHPELELRLRGCSLDDYEAAMRMVIDRNIGVTAEDAEFVMEHVGKTRAVSSGFL